MGDTQQHRFPWATEEDRGNADELGNEVRLEPATIAHAITLLARAMIAVVGANREAGDDR